MACDAAGVRLILDTSLTDAQLMIFVAAANVVLGPDGCDLAGAGISAATIEEVCRFLSAHLATNADPRTLSSRASGHAVTFEGVFGKGLEQSRYGMTARALDPTGCLASVFRDKRWRFKFSVAGGVEADEKAQPLVLRGLFWP